MSQYEDDQEEEELLDDEEGGDLSDEIARKWDPERLLRMVSRKAGRGERLDEATRRKYETKFGVDLGHVRVYSGEFAEEISRHHNADALTIGGTGMILMGGAPDKSMVSTEGRALLAHELTHVAQAERGIHRQASFGESAPLATEAHEEEAEQAADEERGGSGGSDAPSDDEQADALLEKVRTRVLEMFAEDERADLMRNGPERWRS
jgi:hypothetical protein